MPPAPVESTEELLHQFVETRLNAIDSQADGSPYWYTPSTVARCSHPESRFIEDSPGQPIAGQEKLVMLVYPGDGIFRVDSSCQVEASVDLYVMAALAWKGSTNIPWKISQPEPQIQFRLVSDLRRAIMSRPIPSLNGYTTAVTVENRDVKIFVDGYILAQVQVVASFNELWA